MQQEDILMLKTWGLNAILPWNEIEYKNTNKKGK